MSVSPRADLDKIDPSQVADNGHVRTIEAPPRLDTKAQAEAFFRIILGPPDPDGRHLGCAEIRVFDAQERQGRIAPTRQYKKTFSGWFDNWNDYRASLKRLGKVSAFITLNPVGRVLLARACNRLDVSESATKDEDIVCIRFLFLDIDVQRPTNVSSTEDELALALARRDKILADHPDMAESSYWGCSGNGAWALVLLPNYPNDAEHRKLIADALDSLRATYNDAAVEIDEKPKNPSRVMGIVGTLKCKGDSIPERPYRAVTLDSPAGDRDPFDLAGWLERFPPPAAGLPSEAQPAKAEEPTPPKKAGKAGGLTVVAEDWTPERRAIAYLVKCEPSISGQKGHEKLLWAARIRPGFDLTRQATFDILKTHFNPRCDPEWSDREIWHKVDEASKLNTETVGFLRDAEREQPTPKSRGVATAADHTANGQAPGAASEGGSVGFVGNPPQPRPIRVDLRPVPAMVPELIPEPFRGWLADISERASCPLDLPVMSAIVSLGALVGRRVGIRPKRFDDWPVIPNLWGIGVLPPGWLKTHTLEEPKKPLARLELEARERHAAALKDFAVDKAIAEAKAEAAKAALKSASKKTGTSESELKELATAALAEHGLSAPVLRRYIVNDATVEKLGELLGENPFGLLEYRDELMGFLRGLEKQGHEGDRAFYLEAWNGTGSFTYDRIGRGSIFIPSNTVSVLGGIQPGKLAAYIRSTASGENDDGLISRFQLAVYPDIDHPYRHVDRWPDTAAKARAYSVFRAVDALEPSAIGAKVDEGDDGGIPFLRFADDAQGFFDGWRTELEHRVRSSQETASLTSHLSKYRSLMPSLALLFHLIDVVGGVISGPVSLASARLAAAWCDYLEEHARRIYQAAFDGDPEPAQRLADRIRASLPNPFTVRQVVQKGWATLETTEDVERAVAILEAHDWVRQVDVPPGPKGGRPSVAIQINPLVGGGQP